MARCDLGADRRARLAAARLYLVCDAAPGGRELPDVLRARDRRRRRRSCSCARSELADDELAGGRPRDARGAVRASSARCSSSTTAPRWRARRGADGVHVGPGRHAGRARCASSSARTLLIGLSTHAPARDRRPVGRRRAGRLHRRRPGARDADQAGAPGGRRWSSCATRPRTRRVPFFAIGGLRRGQRRRGARRRRVARVRAARDRRRRRAPSAAARELRGAARRGRDPTRAERRSRASPHERARRRPTRAAARRALARAPCEPLREDERPPALLVAIAVCAAAGGRRDRRRAERPRPQPPRRLAAGRDLPRGGAGGCSRGACTAGATGRCSASRRCSPSRSSSPRSRWSSPRRCSAAACACVSDRPRRLAVLEARPRDGPHPGGAKRQSQVASIGSAPRWPRTPTTAS